MSVRWEWGPQHLRGRTQVAVPTVVKVGIASNDFTTRAGTWDFILKPGWVVMDRTDNGMTMAYPGNREEALFVIMSLRVENDARPWLHASISLAKRMPTYEEMVFAKEQIVGIEAKAIEVFPPRSEHVNTCERARHLWCCVAEDPLPDFRVFNPKSGRMEL